MIIQMQSGWFTHFTVGVSTLNDHSDAIGWFTHFTVGVSTLNDHSDVIWLVYTFYNWGFHT